MSTTSMPGEGRIEYEWIDGVERLDMYEPGGYHPVKINDVLYSRYRIVDKLGFGGYSTIWLARDESMERYVAIKVNISGSSQAVPLRETSVLRALSRLRSSTNTLSAGHPEHKFTPEILDEFIIEGPNGLHPCYTVSPAQGNLREASFSRLFPIQVARRLAGNLAQAVSLVHSGGFVHGGKFRLPPLDLSWEYVLSVVDIYLRNVLVRTESNFDELSIDEFRERFGEPEAIPVRRIDGKPLTPNVPPEAVLSLCLGKKAQDFTIADADGLILSDFGETFNPSMEKRLGRHCNTPVSKRAPEALMVPDSPLSFPSDIWSLGLAIWEIVGMKPLFGDCETEDEIVAQQVDVIGDQHFPQSWREHWERQGEEKKDDRPQSNAHWPTCDRGEMASS
ncbi:hypothetical protein NPX13_g11066 [Xylaria arbuscula]|uniref:non-specific serine/threonine protein kinase n=1 Tax=Xylaria arbuscula TaxID=114810 RepID=A0A9W8N3D4_9PEZI|nr:hypothetical protein NPX13_g11066 [Xylaria arbuscula]